MKIHNSSSSPRLYVTHDGQRFEFPVNSTLQVPDEIGELLIATEYFEKVQKRAKKSKAKVGD